MTPDFRDPETETRPGCAKMSAHLFTGAGRYGQNGFGVLACMCVWWCVCAWFGIGPVVLSAGGGPGQVVQ